MISAKADQNEEAFNPCLKAGEIVYFGFSYWIRVLLVKTPTILKQGKLDFFDF